MSSFSFIFMVNQSGCFQFLSYVLFSSAVMAFIPYLTFGSLFLRTPPFSCFCWHHFFSCSYSVLETGVLLVFVFFVLLSTTVLSLSLWLLWWFILCCSKGKKVHLIENKGGEGSNAAWEKMVSLWEQTVNLISCPHWTVPIIMCQYYM